jgi:FAD/FMN-containing dehydrogenase
VWDDEARRWGAKVAAFQPRSIDGIIATVQFARHQGLKSGARGQFHTIFGQSQVQARIVVDTSALDAPGVVAADRVSALAGVLWRTVL